MREITKHVRKEIIQSNFKGFNNFFFLAAADGFTGNRARAKPKPVRARRLNRQR